MLQPEGVHPRLHASLEVRILRDVHIRVVGRCCCHEAAAKRSDVPDRQSRGHAHAIRVGRELGALEDDECAVDSAPPFAVERNAEKRVQDPLIHVRGGQRRIVRQTLSDWLSESLDALSTIGAEVLAAIVQEIDSPLLALHLRDRDHCRLDGVNLVRAVVQLDTELLVQVILDFLDHLRLDALAQKAFKGGFSKSLLFHEVEEILRQSHGIRRDHNSALVFL
mmetsp:Transcript_6501/g.20882  ORF Transcript_6501/g.20882 Transcript_6501/m.20882 type:complete len:222 (+) Transcript_6501:522-1187(+)